MAVTNGLHEQAQQDTCIGVATAFTAVSLIIVGLRVYTRTVILRNMGKDDWAMISAVFFTVAYLVELYVARQNGMGFSGAKLSLTQMENLIKVTVAIQYTYYFIVFSIKASILFLYLRFAAKKSFERACKYTIWLMAVFTVICLICVSLQCVPLNKMWDFTGLVAGKCGINTTALFYSTSAFNIITDVWIIALPIPILLSIHRPRREKIGLLGVFGLGVVSCIASIVRLHSIRLYTLSKDPFYDAVPINLWSMIEVNIGIWCASIPALKALISRAQRERSRGMTGSGYKYHSRDKSGTGRIRGSIQNLTVVESQTDGSRGTMDTRVEAYDMGTVIDKKGINKEVHYSVQRSDAANGSPYDPRAGSSEEHIVLAEQYDGKV